MRDPKRLLDGSEARGLERRLIEAGSSVRLSSERKALLWQTIAARVPAPAARGPEAPDPAAHPTAPPEGLHALPASPDPAGQPGPAGPPQAGPAGPAHAGPAATDPPLSAPAPAPPPAPLDAPPEPIAGLPTPLAASGVKIAVGAVILALGGLGYLRSIAPGAAPAEEGRGPESAALVASAARPDFPPPATVSPPARPLAPEARPQPSGGPALAVTASPTRREPASDGAPRASTPEPTPPPAASPPPSAPAIAEPPALAEPPAVPPASAPKTPAEIAQQERVNRMKEETEMTRAARSALRAGNAVEALRLLEEVRAKFGGGLLWQEREALTIEALARTGQRAQAQTRAEAFLKAFPTSVHAADVRMFAP